MPTKGMNIWSGINVALGAASFVMLLPGVWFWIGFFCAIAALVIGTKGRKSPHKSKQVCSIISIVLAVVAAALYISFMLIAGVRLPELL